MTQHPTTQPSEGVIPEALVRRCVAVVREAAASNWCEPTPAYILSARAIVAELPKPISIDLLEARRLAADDAEENCGHHAFVNDGAGGLTRLYGASLARAIRDGRGDDTVAVRGRLIAIKRSRELATGKEGC